MKEKGKSKKETCKENRSSVDEGLRMFMYCTVYVCTPYRHVLPTVGKYLMIGFLLNLAFAHLRQMIISPFPFLFYPPPPPPCPSMT